MDFRAPSSRHALMSRMQADLDESKSGSDKPPDSDMLRRILPKGQKLHVCVVGAGFAGLRCADVLLQHGVQVTIVEARDRVGGRVSSSRPFVAITLTTFSCIKAVLEDI